MAASPVLRAMFTTDMKEFRTNSVKMKEFSPEAVEQFLEYAYTGQLVLEACKNLCIAHLWGIGDKYLVPGLVEYLEEVHKSHIKVDNVMSVYIEARQV